MYRDSEAAQAALQRKEPIMPFLSNAVESWHALLMPFAHKGECNHLDRNEPGPVFEIGSPGAGGPCMVITTAGFNFGPDLKIERVINFRRNVDTTNEWMARADGCLTSQVFTPHTVGDDGFTMSIWRDDAAMLEAAYRPGFHRSQIERHKVESFFDRSSFTRFRILVSSGLWDGRDPLHYDAR
jgi:hypothetical protein